MLVTKVLLPYPLIVIIAVGYALQITEATKPSGLEAVESYQPRTFPILWDYRSYVLPNFEAEQPSPKHFANPGPMCGGSPTMQCPGGKKKWCKSISMSKSMHKTYRTHMNCKYYCYTMGDWSCCNPLAQNPDEC